MGEARLKAVPVLKAAKQGLNYPLPRPRTASLQPGPRTGHPLNSRRFRSRLDCLPRTPQPASLRTRLAPWLRRAVPLALLLLGVSVGFLGPYAWVLDKRVQVEFGRLQWQVPTRVHARPLELANGLAQSAAALEQELLAARPICRAMPRPRSARRNAARK